MRGLEHGRWAVLLLSLLICGFALLATRSPAAGAQGLDIRATLGIGGWVSPGEVTPLRVDVRSPSAVAGTLQVDVPSGIRGSVVTTHLLPLRLSAGGRQQAYLDLIVRDPRRPITIAVRDGGGERFRQDLPVGVGRVVEGIVAALTHEAAGLEFVTGAEGKRRPAYITEEDLPVRWQAYDAIDLLIVRDLDPRSVLPAQARALVEWVSQGGRLLVVAPLRLNLAEASWLRDLIPPEGQRTYGRGLVVVAREDLFAPARRSAGELRAQVRSILDHPRAFSAGDAALADILPSTRPLPGGTQVGLAILSLLYVAAIRVVLRRFGAARGGWLAITALIALSTAGLYMAAAASRTAATSLAQLSIVEMLGTLDAARATTYASIIAPYGGRFAVRVPEGGTVRTLMDVAVTYDEETREIRGAAADGQLSVAAREIIALRLHVRLREPDLVIVDRTGPMLDGVVLYRGRQLYRLPSGAAETVRLDPARWEPVDRQGALGADTAGRAMDLLFRQFDRIGDATWFVARIADDRVWLRTARGDGSDRVALVVMEIR